LIGTWLYSPRIIRAISFDYSNIGPRRSIAALGTAAILAQIGIYFGIPISFNEAVIAAVIGSGLVEGKSNIDGKKNWIYCCRVGTSVFRCDRSCIPNRSVYNCTVVPGLLHCSISILLVVLDCESFQIGQNCVGSP